MYYIGSMPFGQDDLQHWGVLGMKWGVRRYQNPDGTLTEAGKKRYGDVGHYEYRSFGQKRKQKQVDKARAKDKKMMDELEKSTIDNKDGTVTITDPRTMFESGKARHDLWKKESQLEAYKKRDADRQKYAEKTSGLKAGVQKGLKVATSGVLPGGLDVQYQRARSRGEGRVSSLLKSRDFLISAGALVGATAGYAVPMIGARMTLGKDHFRRLMDLGKLNGVVRMADSNFYRLAENVMTGVSAGTAAGAVAGYAGHKIHTMNENKKKYGHRMWT